LTTVVPYQQSCSCAKKADVDKLDNPVWPKFIQHLCAKHVTVIQNPSKKPLWQMLKLQKWTASLSWFWG